MLKLSKCDKQFLKLQISETCDRHLLKDLKCEKHLLKRLKRYRHLIKFG